MNLKILSGIAVVRHQQAEIAKLKELARGLRDGLRLINSGDHEDKPHTVAGHVLFVFEDELRRLGE